jgi:hypothetical protein
MAYAIPTQHSTHSLQALQTLRVCLFGLANRRIPRTLYAMPFQFLKKAYFSIINLTKLSK